MKTAKEFFQQENNYCNEAMAGVSKGIFDLMEKYAKYRIKKQIEQRIVQLENDKLIDSRKKAMLIRENKRFLVLIKQSI